jgi:SAM-dependent methyltransferase
MEEVTKRIVELSPERRQLLEKLLKSSGGGAGGVACQPAPDQRQSSVESTGPPEPAPGAAPAAPAISFVDDDQAPVDTSPEGTKTMYRRFYNAVSTQLDSSVFGEFSYFLNYGYVADLSPQCAVVPLPEHQLNRNSVKLVLELVGDCPVDGRRVLDVGCGRGGTVHVLTHFFSPRSVTGLDLSAAAIAFCRRVHRYPNVRFEEGDAENLPFADASFDVVTNVESSHGYPQVHSFYREVYRVLAPGGHFLYTDVMPVESRQEGMAFLESLGFRIERERDITANVLLSCDEIARTRVQAFDSVSNDPELMANFLAVPGSGVYDALQQRIWTYNMAKMRKPE